MDGENTHSLKRENPEYNNVSKIAYTNISPSNITIEKVLFILRKNQTNQNNPNINNSIAVNNNFLSQTQQINNNNLYNMNNNNNNNFINQNNQINFNNQNNNNTIFNNNNFLSQSQQTNFNNLNNNIFLIPPISRFSNKSFSSTFRIIFQIIRHNNIFNSFII